MNAHITAYINSELKLDDDGKKETTSEPTINEFGERVRTNNDKKFIVQEIGKATVNVPLKAKQEVDEIMTAKKLDEGNNSGAGGVR